MKNYASSALTITLEPIKTCNINCSYCYCNNNLGTRIDTDELDFTLDCINSYVQESGHREIHFIWHGGEPLLMGVEYYRYAFASIERLFPAIKVHHFLQTNGLLIDNDYLALFEDYQVAVGVSLDGPPDIHDRYRKDFNEQGTHQQVMGVVEKLISRKLELGFNLVVTRYCLGNEEIIYGFFKDIGYGFRVNPLLISPGQEAARDYTLPKLGYGQFLCALFDIWTSTDNNRITISPISSYLKAMLKGRSIECQHSANCVGDNIGIKPGGQVYLCTRFEDYSLGNLKTQSLSEIFRNYRAAMVSRRQHNISECQSCKYKPICHGGCPHNAHTFYNTVAVRDPYCNDYQMIFSHMKKALRPFDNDEKIIVVGR